MNIKYFIIKLTVIVSLIISGAMSTTVVAATEIDQLLNKAEKFRTSNIEKFTKTLNELQSKQAVFTTDQKFYLQYLNAFLDIAQGNTSSAINIFQQIADNSSNKLLRFKASISLVNLYALNKRWLKGFKYLEYISSQHPNIHDPDVRIKGLIITTFYYNQLEQYEIASNFSKLVLKENLSERNKCLILTQKIQADLYTGNTKNLTNQTHVAINICNKIGEFNISNVIRGHLVTYYLIKNQNIKAISLLEEHLNEINNSNSLLLITVVNSLLSQAYLKTKQFVKAEKHALRAVSNNQKSPLKEVMGAYEVLASVSSINKDYDNALNYQQKYMETKELLFNQTNAKQLAVESAKHQAAERENQITLLNKQNEISHLELKNQKQKQIVWGILLVASALLIFFLNYRKNASKELARQKQVNWELKQLDKLKDQILANTSHELRTPLNGIIGLSELIIMEYEESVEDDLIKSIRLIGKSGTQLALIVNDILDLAQLKSGRMAFKNKEFDLIALINDVCDLCEPLIKKVPIKFVFNQQQQTLLVIQDEQRVQQLLFNLIGNATKFTNEGEVTIKCELTNEYLKVQIKDTGIGIPADKLQRVFKGFEQVDGSNTRKHSGSGIGLAICKELINSLEGNIQLESELGKGTNITFSLPLQTLT